MRRWLAHRTARRLATLELCERCGTVCDAACRSHLLRESSRDRVLGAVVVR